VFLAAANTSARWNRSWPPGVRQPANFPDTAQLAMVRWLTEKIDATSRVSSRSEGSEWRAPRPTRRLYPEACASKQRVNISKKSLNNRLSAVVP
jgi:hypothetical protein